MEGGRELVREVDLATLPLYVRAGAIFPLGPVKQYTSEKIDAALSVTIYPGADGSFSLYEDDGESFDYRRGEWMGVEMKWDDGRRVFHMRLMEGSRMLAPLRRQIDVHLEKETRRGIFEGRPVEVSV